MKTDPSTEAVLRCCKVALFVIPIGMILQALLEPVGSEGPWGFYELAGFVVTGCYALGECVRTLLRRWSSRPDRVR